MTRRKGEGQIVWNASKPATETSTESRRNLDGVGNKRPGATHFRSIDRVGEQILISIDKMMNTRHSLGALMALFMDTYFFSPGEIIYIYIYIYKFSKHYEIWHTCS
jgi:hypothetical protein